MFDMSLTITLRCMKRRCPSTRNYELSNYLNTPFHLFLSLTKTDQELMVWRQLHLLPQQQRQQILSSSTPHNSSQIDASNTMPLQDVMLKDQLRYEKRRLSENDLDGDIKHPKLSSIENNTCTSATLPLSLSEVSLAPVMRPHVMAMSSFGNDVRPYNTLLSHREKTQNQQYLERLRRMNERSHARERGSRVNFDQHNSAKTV